jgi:S-(hydroxymethyl)glutathione dehydrogenase / alcohol dehydrogenase
LLDRYSTGDVDVDPFISHRISLEDINRVSAQDGIRGIIEF